MSETMANFDELLPSAQRVRILKALDDFDTRLTGVEVMLRMNGENMATLLELTVQVRDAVNARIDREIAKGQQALAEKQNELNALVAAEDAEDVTQNAEIARLQAEIAGQTEAIAVLEGLKTGVESDLAAVPTEPAPVEPAPVPADTAPVLTEEPGGLVQPQPIEPAPVEEPGGLVVTEPVTEPVPAVEPTQPVEQPAPVEVPATEPVVVQPEAPVVEPAPVEAAPVTEPVVEQPVLVDPNQA